MNPAQTWGMAFQARDTSAKAPKASVAWEGERCWLHSGKQLEHQSGPGSGLIYQCEGSDLTLQAREISRYVLCCHLLSLEVKIVQKGNSNFVRNVQICFSNMFLRFFNLSVFLLYLSVWSISHES